MFEKRKVKVLINKAGGNAGKNSLNYKISLPTNWIKELKITPENRDVIIAFDGEKIIIKKEK